MKSREEIVANKLYDLLADSRLEPHLIGRYFAQMATTEIYDKFDEMIASAEYEKEHRIYWLKKMITGEVDEEQF